MEVGYYWVSDLQELNDDPEIAYWMGEDEGWAFAIESYSPGNNVKVLSDRIPEPMRKVFPETLFTIDPGVTGSGTFCPHVTVTVKDGGLISADFYQQVNIHQGLSDTLEFWVSSVTQKTNENENGSQKPDGENQKE